MALPRRTAALLDGRAALDTNAPQLWPQAPGNVALDWEGDDEDAVRTAFARAAHVTRLAVVNNNAEPVVAGRGATGTTRS